MKKKALLFASLATLIAVQLIQAKDYTLVVRGKGLTSTGHTEVTVNDGENGDSITITPGLDATTITVSIEDADGTVIQQQSLSASGDSISINAQPSPEGRVMVIRDDNNVVYTDDVE